MVTKKAKGGESGSIQIQRSIKKKDLSRQGRKRKGPGGLVELGKTKRKGGKGLGSKENRAPGSPATPKKQERKTIRTEKKKGSPQTSEKTKGSPIKGKNAKEWEEPRAARKKREKGTGAWGWAKMGKTIIKGRKTPTVRQSK